MGYASGVGVVVSLELRQRVRGAAWYVLLAIFFALVAIVTVLLTVALRGFDARDTGGGVYSAIIYFVLLLGTLVAPALSGNAINGDRDSGTLATTQVTLITTGQLVLGKFLASWATALAFLAVALPFLVFSGFLGGLSAAATIVSILVLAFELGVIAAIGVGLSGLIARPLFSIVATYLVVATLSIGTLIAFALGGLVVQSPQTITTSSGTTYDETGAATECGPPTTTTNNVPRFDYFWGVLDTNPYVLLADAVPTKFDAHGNANDLFGSIKFGARTAQVPPKASKIYDECAIGVSDDVVPTARTVIDSTVPGWFVGLLIHLVLATAAIAGAWARTRTPAGRLTRGSRVA